MGDFVELMVGMMVCVLPPIVVIGGFVALFRYLRSGRDDERIGDLEAAILELRGQNFTLLQRVSRLEQAAQAPHVPVSGLAEVVAEAAENAGIEGDESDVGATHSTAAAATDVPVEEGMGPFYGPVLETGPVYGPVLEDVVAAAASQAAAEAASASVAAPAAPTLASAPASAPAPMPPPEDKGGIAWEQWIGVR
ncbi:MAG: hypothetical protein KC619_27345, partial [Myxococcales bacterium]|nr:hypothetical protein [Myxococcales bacterium]